MVGYPSVDLALTLEIWEEYDGRREDIARL